MTIGIIGTGSAVPENCVTNDDLVKLGLETTDDWIKERSGISERRIKADDEKTSDFATRAAQKAIESAGINASDIDLIIIGTATSDYAGFPSTACIVQDKLGIDRCIAFDVPAACTGFNVALTTAEQFLKTGMCKMALVVGADCLSQVTDWADRSTCVLFADGAGAAIVSEVSEGHGILDSRLYGDGQHAEILKINNSQLRQPFNQEKSPKEEPTIQMEGRSVFKVAIEAIVPAIQDAIKQVGITIEDVDHVILHQANKRILNVVKDKCGIKEERMHINLDRYGNTSAASIPIGLDELNKKGALKDGQTLLLVGFGGGFTWGNTLLKWGK